jgi:hypothetical protein
MEEYFSLKAFIKRYAAAILGEPQSNVADVRTDSSVSIAFAHCLRYVPNPA